MVAYIKFSTACGRAFLSAVLHVWHRSLSLWSPCHPTAHYSKISISTIISRHFIPTIFMTYLLSDTLMVLIVSYLSQHKTFTLGYTRNTSFLVCLW